MKNTYRGSILLIAGCCIGAGMLGAPVVTGAAGFIPATLLFIAIWAFMALSGLVLSELVLSYDDDSVNLLSIAKDTLGSFGKIIVTTTFMFLFYAIMTAYILASSSLIAQVLPIAQTAAASIFVLAIYAVLAKGIQLIDGCNRVLMTGLVVCYVMLVIFGISSVDTESLQYVDFSASIVSIPILVVSFGYHNLIPTLATYLNRSKKHLMKAICFGSLIPLAVYILWEFVILGIVPAENFAVWKSAQNSGEMITQVLASCTDSTLVVSICQNFAFFAIATSFLPVAFSFVDFLKDGLRQNEQRLAYVQVTSSDLQLSKKAIEQMTLGSEEFSVKKLFTNSYFIAALVVLPPFIATLIEPNLFLHALDFAGGICAVTLFGILPAVMAYRRQKMAPKSFVIAKKPVLAFLLIGSLSIMAIELAHLSGLIS